MDHATATGRPEDASPRPGSGPGRLVDVRVEAGPDGGRRVVLGRGRHLVGRAPQVGVRLDDPAVEAHHAVIDVGVDGAVTIRQITGRAPVRVAGGEPLAAGAMAVGVAVELGSSRLSVHPDPGPETARAREPSVVVRTPRRIPARPDVVVRVPEAGPLTSGFAPGASTLVAATITGLGAAAVAIVVGQPMFAIIGAVGALAAVATWVVSKLAAGRARRRQRRRQVRSVQRFRTEIATVAAALRVSHLARAAPGWLVEDAPTLTWCRRPDHGDAFVVTVGVGAVRLPISLVDAGGGPVAPGSLPGELQASLETGEQHDDLPVLVDLAASPRQVVAISGGGRAIAVARSMLLQLAEQTGPADWRLVALAADRRQDAWLLPLPHLVTSASAGPAVLDPADVGKIAAVLAGLEGDDDRRLVVLTDSPSLLTVRTGPLRQLLDRRRATTVLVAVPDDEPVPAACTSLVHVGERWRGRWIPDPAGGSAPDVRLHVTGCTLATAIARARTLSGLVDPEDPAIAQQALPAVVSIDDVMTIPDTPERLVDHWRSAGPDPAPSVRLGATAGGRLEIDIARDGPHALVAGTTGAGKSELLRTLVVGLAIGQSPAHLNFLLVDYKGGAAFDTCERLPHVVGVVTDLDRVLAARALDSLGAEIRRRERLMRDAGVADLTGHRQRVGGAPVARLAVVVDEFAALAAELPEFLAALVDVAQRGRSLGIHLVLATQRPAGVISDDIRANTNLRIALRLADEADAVDVVGDVSPTRLPRGVPGRGVLRLGPGELVEFQTARVGGAGRPIGGVVELCRAAVASEGGPPPHRPWLPPLPGRLAADEIPEHALGLIDRPDEQRRDALVWSPGDGHLAVVGSAAAGLTGILRSVAVATVARRPDTALYVIDAPGSEELRGLLRLPGCAAVVRLHEQERLDRLVRLLSEEVRSRRTGEPGAAERPIVVVVDGLATVRSLLDSPQREPARLALDEVLDDGAVAGVTVVASLDAARGATGVLSRFATRWVGHLDAATDGPAFGVPTARVPPPVAGRVVVTASGHLAQVALLGPEDVTALAAGPVPDVDPPPAITTLPAIVRAETLPAHGDAHHGVTELTVGLDADSLTPAVLQVPDGDHVLVVGPARSGRTACLARLASAWISAHPAGRWSILCGSPRSPLAEHPACIGSVEDLAPFVAAGGPGDGWESGGHLVVIDDAERVEDPSGALARWAEAGAVTVVAAGRADALRSTFGHWTGIVRRSRLGLVMSASADLDGDLLSVMLPRRCPIPPRPGLAWATDGTGLRLVQVALGTLPVDPGRGNRAGDGGVATGAG